ncbi:MAG: cytidine deaminase [Oscillospiraceae bacterium]|nr:cytidine deaminase [Oscillospiraceae bacterium]MDY6207435.1 cytidine deaminase [Oscillospiraceae bacterium]
MTDNKLMELAEKACENAYAPYSKFKVGAALLSSDERVFTGCNVENSSYGAGICAERTAAVKAVSEGAVRFSAIAIANAGGGLTFPCGICRQFLSEFAEEGFRIILRNDKGELEIFTLEELMPHGFKL